MTDIGFLDSAETLAQFVARVKEAENITTRHVVSAYALKLYPKGDLAVANIGDHLQITNKGVEDLARISDTPIVAFGVSLAEDSKGAVQVQGATFRLACLNGAVVRICQGNEHRLRRPLDTPSGMREFLRRVRVFAQIAWEQWEENAEELRQLPTVPLFQERFVELRATLRQAPFFLSDGIVRQVLRQMVNEAHRENREPTAYDLWNSLSWFGTHDEDLSLRSRYFLRIGARELAKHKSKTCAACRQLVIS